MSVSYTWKQFIDSEDFTIRIDTSVTPENEDDKHYIIGNNNTRVTIVSMSDIDEEHEYYKTLKEAKHLTITNVVFNCGDMIHIFQPSVHSFTYAGELQTLVFKNVDTSNISSMYELFANTGNLKTLDISCFNTSNVTNMSYMFCNSGVEKLDLRNFNTSKVTNMSGMFTNTAKMTELNVSSFDTSKVTTFSLAFNDCDSLVSLNLSNFNTTSAKDMNSMFQGCDLLKSIDVTSFDVSNCDTMEYMFHNCKSLETLDIRSFHPKEDCSIEGMLGRYLELLEIPNLQINEDLYERITKM